MGKTRAKRTAKPMRYGRSYTAVRAAATRDMRKMAVRWSPCMSGGTQREQRVASGLGSGVVLVLTAAGDGGEYAAANTGLCVVLIRTNEDAL